MAGLVPAIHVLLRDYIVKILPTRIIGDYQPNFPGSGPMLNVMFALNSVMNILKSLEIDESLKTIAFCKTFDQPRTMFEYTANKIIVHAYVKDAVRLIC